MIARGSQRGAGQRDERRFPLHFSNARYKVTTLSLQSPALPSLRELDQKAANNQLCLRHSAAAPKGWRRFLMWTVSLRLSHI